MQWRRKCTRSQGWLVEIAIEPQSKADGEKLLIALVKLAAEDPTFGMSIDHESGQTILKGASELHLDTKLDVLRRTYNIDARVGAPQVAFRECITQPTEVEYAYKKQSGGAGQFAVVRLRVEPNDPGKGYQFESKITSGAVPKEYIPGVEKGIESVLSSGVVAGFPVVDIKVELIDGKYHDVDSSALTFEIAARAAFREALQKAKSVLLEPIMKVEVVTPEDCISSAQRATPRASARHEPAAAVPNRPVVAPRASWSLILGLIVATLREWRRRRVGRRELASLDERTLRDIGLDPGIVDYEVYQSFWLPPRDWRD